MVTKGIALEVVDAATEIKAVGAVMDITMEDSKEFHRSCRE